MSSRKHQKASSVVVDPSKVAWKENTMEDLDTIHKEEWPGAQGLETKQIYTYIGKTSQ